MKKWTAKISAFYLQVINSIAFYPTLLTVIFIVFSIIVMSIEYNALVIDFKEKINRFLVHDPNNARLILGTIVGSLISLMVFSFSMVMVVLNNATSTLSPRVLPGLISNKFHQIVLGFYVGTIIFSLILIININSPDIEYTVPSLGILFSMLLAMFCLGLFVYFIHSISQKIQVDNILNDIFNKTKSEIEEADDGQKETMEPNSSGWYEYTAAFSGYLKRINLEGLRSFCEKNEILIVVCSSLGDYVVRQYPIIKSSKKLEEDAANDIMSFFILYPEERIADHYSFGFKQISEIAVKALSPGINDPGTAMKAIDQLSELYIRVMEIHEQSFIRHSDETKDLVIIYLNVMSFEDLLFKNLIPIRSYGNHDILVLIHLLDCLHHLIYADRERKRFYHVLRKFVHNIVVCSKDNITNDLDKSRINDRVEIINQLLDNEHKIEKF